MKDEHVGVYRMVVLTLVAITALDQQRSGGWLSIYMAWLIFLLWVLGMVHIRRSQS